MTMNRTHWEWWEWWEAVFRFRILCTVFSMRAQVLTPSFALGLAHMFLIFNSFIRKRSKYGVHLYNTRKHAACMHMQSQFIAVWTAVLGTVSWCNVSLLQPNCAHERMNSSHLSATSFDSDAWRMHCSSFIMREYRERCALHWSTSWDSLVSNVWRTCRWWGDSFAVHDIATIHCIHWIQLIRWIQFYFLSFIWIIQTRSSSFSVCMCCWVWSCCSIGTRCCPHTFRAGCVWAACSPRKWFAPL